MKQTRDEGAVRDEARRLYERGSDDNLEIDEDATVIFLLDEDNGAFVAAWVFVPFDTYQEKGGT